MSAAAERQRRYLERQQSGLIVVQIVAPDDLLAEMLERAEFLPRDGKHSRDELRQALQHVVDLWLGCDASIDSGGSSLA